MGNWINKEGIAHLYKKIRNDVTKEIESLGIAAKGEAAVVAAEKANDTADHPTYVGEDNYVYQWDRKSKTYTKTDIYVKGEKGDVGGFLYPLFKQLNNHLYITDYESKAAQRIKKRGSHLVLVVD